jgi:hypothetical protein
MLCKDESDGRSGSDESRDLMRRVVMICFVVHILGPLRLLRDLSVTGFFTEELRSNRKGLSSFHCVLWQQDEIMS